MNRPLVTHYEASPTWAGDTLHLAELSAPCRHMEDDPGPLLCCLRRTVTAADCS